MVSLNTPLIGPSKRWITTAFLLAAGLFVGHAVVSGLGEFTDVAPPPDLFAPAGHLVALVGLFALALVLGDGTTLLGRIATGVTAVLAVGWALVGASMLASALIGLPPTVQTVFRGLAVVVLVSTVLPYALVGALSRRSDGHTRVLGFLIAAPGVLLVGLMVAVATVGGAGTGLVVGSGLAVTVGAVGLRLRSEIDRAGVSQIDGTGAAAR